MQPADKHGGRGCGGVVDLTPPGPPERPFIGKPAGFTAPMKITRLAGLIGAASANLPWPSRAGRAGRPTDGDDRERPFSAHVVRGVDEHRATLVCHDPYVDAPVPTGHKTATGTPSHPLPRHQRGRDRRRGEPAGGPPGRVVRFGQEADPAGITWIGPDRHGRACRIASRVGHRQGAARPRRENDCDLAFAHRDDLDALHLGRGEVTVLDSAQVGVPGIQSSCHDGECGHGQ